MDKWSVSARAEFVINIPMDRKVLTDHMRRALCRVLREMKTHDMFHCPTRAAAGASTSRAPTRR